jgi:hypothetical protein
MKLLHKREDGTFVVELNGMPYHVLPTDKIWQDTLRAEALLENPLPPEANEGAEVNSIEAQMTKVRARLLAALVDAVLTGDTRELQALADRVKLLRPHMPA